MHSEDFHSYIQLLIIIISYIIKNRNQSSTGPACPSLATGSSGAVNVTNACFRLLISTQVLTHARLATSRYPS